MGVLVNNCFWSFVTHTLSFKPVLRVQHRRLVASCALPCETCVPLELGETYSINTKAFFESNSTRRIFESEIVTRLDTKPANMHSEGCCLRHACLSKPVTGERHALLVHK